MKQLMYGSITAAALSVTYLAGASSVTAYGGDANYIIERILFCIDGSDIRNGSISTYCNR